MQSFEKNKSAALIKKDKSKKGSIDIEIKPLLGLINSFSFCYTTSSCSGRILLIKKPETKRKCDTEFLFSSQSCTSLDEIKKHLSSLPKEEVWLKQEPFIIHIRCRTIHDAQKLISCCSRAGLKHSGIISAEKKTTLEIIGSGSIETIISKNRKLLPDDSYLKAIIDSANTNMKKNQSKIQNLYKQLASLGVFPSSSLVKKKRRNTSS